MTRALSPHLEAGVIDLYSINLSTPIISVEEPCTGSASREPPGQR
jgi:hypothetical protein